jgi:DNA-binding response OmpR family regulator
MALHVAVFNDHSSILRLMQYILESGGYRATIHLQRLTNAEDVAALDPDLIVLGYFAGLDLTELGILDELRTNAITANKPILIVTTLPQYVEQFLKEKPFPNVTLLGKPFAGPMFMEAVRSLLKQTGLLPNQREVISGGADSSLANG